jgi:hypothetical protein
MKEPVKCRCGEKAIMKCSNTSPRWWVRCVSGSPFCGNCWVGPVRDTKRKAINAWDKVMEVK